MIERLGKMNRVVTAGLAVVVPVIERIAYAHSLKEVAMPITSQTAVTQDNVRLELDGVLYMKVHCCTNHAPPRGQMNERGSSHTEESMGDTRHSLAL